MTEPRPCARCGGPTDPTVDHNPTGDQEVCDACCPDGAVRTARLVIDIDAERDT